MKPLIQQPPSLSSKLKIDRILGSYSKDINGPTLVCICGMHGNEPSGVEAFQHVFDHIRDKNPPFKGSMIGLVGNIPAISKGKRFINMDLNRAWTADRIEKILNNSRQEETVEAREQKDLMQEINRTINNKSGPVYFIDLHTTSSQSQPFISINDTLRNRKFAMKYPLPIVLGIEEYLEGTLLSYINELGHIALGFEAGQHDDPVSIANHEAIIWLMLSFCGCLSNNNDVNVRSSYNILAKNIVHRKKVFEIRHRQAVAINEKFRMNSGYTNFQPIKRNEVLASNISGDIKAKEQGEIFMPLYQAQGEDGFFIIRQIKRFWLTVSEVLRKTRFHRFLHLLPGVGMYRGLKHTLVVNTKIARWYVVEFFHLMGFRKKRRESDLMIFTKRVYDVDEPD